MIRPCVTHHHWNSSHGSTLSLHPLLSSICDMRNDLNETFGQIFNNDITSFREQLLAIQDHVSDRKAAERWVEQLRFLDIADVPDLQGVKTKCVGFRHIVDNRQPFYIPITQRSHDDGDEYVAVSWRWYRAQDLPSCGSAMQPTFDYFVQRPGLSPHKSDFPDQHMERVIRFAQSIGVTKLWIDTECIYQRKEDGPEDKDQGVQIMDVVYGDSEASAGLLTTPLTHQYEIDTLSSLLCRSIFVETKNEQSPKLRPGVNVKTIQKVILKVLSDIRWSRGWIFQEDHLASAAMTLLIPHHEELDKGKLYDFGNIAGELQVNLAEFRQVVTMFCLASPGDDATWPKSEILGKAKQYNIWNRRLCRHGHKEGGVCNRSDGKRRKIDDEMLSPLGSSSDILLPTTTNSVLDDICNRTLESEQDRVAILANALRFPERLNVQKDSPITQLGAYSLSTALLALILMNGEILSSTGSEHLPSAENPLQHTLRSYLKACEHKFNAPSPRFKQTAIESYRFRSPVITRRGIETKGFLFRLAEIPRSSGRARNGVPIWEFGLPRKQLIQMSQHTWSTSIPRGQKLNAVARKAIKAIIAKLYTLWPNSRLAAFLSEHLELDLDPSAVPSPSTLYILDAMTAISEGIIHNRELRLACLDTAPPYAEPLALFIAPEPNGWTMGSHDKVFTSWDGRRGNYERERFVSLHVQVHDAKGLCSAWNVDNKRCFLRSHGWVNGVWDIRGERMATYVFPLPGITEKRGGLEMKRKRKRCNVEEANG
jgi:hypothetical protein